jgi:hypothetical protein
MCIYANIVDNESFRCLELERSTSDKEGPAPASLSWKYSTGGRKVLEKDTAVAFSIDTGDAMDCCLEEDVMEVMDWTAEEDSSDYMDWTAVQFDEATEMEWTEVHFDEEMEYCVDETISDDIDMVDQEDFMDCETEEVCCDTTMEMKWEWEVEVEFEVCGEAMDCD